VPKPIENILDTVGLPLASEDAVISDSDPPLSLETHALPIGSNASPLGVFNPLMISVLPRLDVVTAFASTCPEA